MTRVNQFHGSFLTTSSYLNDDDEYDDYEYDDEEKGPALEIYGTD
jgi:hypothetical protein